MPALDVTVKVGPISRQEAERRVSVGGGQNLRIEGGRYIADADGASYVVGLVDFGDASVSPADARSFLFGTPNFKPIPWYVWAVLAGIVVVALSMTPPGRVVAVAASRASGKAVKRAAKGAATKVAKRAARAALERV